MSTAWTKKSMLCFFCCADGIDFISLSQVPLSLHHLNALQCVPIEILNDRVAEGPQNFTVVMEALHVTELVTVSTSMATVIIYDDDDESGEENFSFTAPTSEEYVKDHKKPTQFQSKPLTIRLIVVHGFQPKSFEI